MVPHQPLTHGQGSGFSKGQKSLTLTPTLHDPTLQPPGLAQPLYITSNRRQENFPPPPVPGPGENRDVYEVPEVRATLEELKIVQQFIEGIRNASLDADPLPTDVIERLRDPPTTVFNLDDHEALRTAIKLFIASETASEEVFNKSRNVFNDAMQRQLGDNFEALPSLYVVKERIKEITGVYLLMHDMCPNTCMAYISNS